MGAYYSYQTINNENEVILESYKLEKYFRFKSWDIGGLNFLESFWQQNPLTQSLYYILKKVGKPMIVNTVCGYDDEGSFKREIVDSWRKDIFSKITFDTKKLRNFIVDVNKNENYIKKGYIVCNEKKQYFEINYFYDDYAVASPLALLTRNSATSQGGGDFDIKDVDFENKKDKYKFFEINKNFDKSLVTSWKDKEVRYTENITDDIKEYEDISEKIFLKRY